MKNSLVGNRNDRLVGKGAFWGNLNIAPGYIAGALVAVAAGAYAIVQSDKNDAAEVVDLVTKNIEAARSFSASGAGCTNWNQDVYASINQDSRFDTSATGSIKAVNGMVSMSSSCEPMYTDSFSTATAHVEDSETDFNVISTRITGMSDEVCREVAQAVTPSAWAAYHSNASGNIITIKLYSNPAVNSANLITSCNSGETSNGLILFSRVNG